MKEKTKRAGTYSLREETHAALLHLASEQARSKSAIIDLAILETLRAHISARTGKAVSTKEAEKEMQKIYYKQKNKS